MFRVLVAAAVLVYAAGGALASMGAVSLRALAENADLIIYGQVDSLATEKHPFQPEANGEMQGRALYRVHASVSGIIIIKGYVPDSGVVVTTSPGMEDDPVFRPGEHLILFLVRNEGKETFSTLALAHGKFDVSGGQVIREGVPVQEFLSQIRDYLR